jgi:acyl-CoA synthetase (AMP-forming)/AMP-acid ligase II
MISYLRPNANLDKRNEEHLPRFSTVSEVISAYAATRPTHNALIFLEDGEDKSAQLNYEALHRRATESRPS